MGDLACDLERQFVLPGLKHSYVRAYRSHLLCVRTRAIGKNDSNIITANRSCNRIDRKLCTFFNASFTRPRSRVLRICHFYFFTLVHRIFLPSGYYFRLLRLRNFYVPTRDQLLDRFSPRNGCFSFDSFDWYIHFCGKDRFSQDRVVR